jgi:hypothetical protein
VPRLNAFYHVSEPSDMDVRLRILVKMILRVLEEVGKDGVIIFRKIEENM